MSDVKFCPYCGKEVPAGAHFCGECGKELPHEAAEAGVPTVPPPQTTISAVLQNQPPQKPRRVPDVGFAENFLKSEGRLNRLRYFKRSIVVGILGMIIFLIVASFVDGNSRFEQAILAIAAGCTLPVSLMLNTRRLQDMGRDGTIADNIMRLDAAMYLMPVIFYPWEPPIENIAYIHFETLDYVYYSIVIISCVLNLYLLFAPGTHGDNKYGPSPLH